MIRLFIALIIPPDIKTQLDKIINSLKTDNTAVKWVSPRNLHLTIKFIGNTDPSKVTDIITQLEKTSQKYTPIQSNFSGLGGFPNLHNPRVIWIDIIKNRDKIISLAKDIDQSLTQVGFEKDAKPFKPHLTLGRVKNNNQKESLTYLRDKNIEDIDITFDSLELIHSTLTQRGPIYKTLHTIKLGETFSG